MANVPVVGDAPAVPQSVFQNFCKNVPAPVKRGCEIMTSIAKGGVGGYAAYWFTRLLIKLKFIETGGVPVNPVSYVLLGMVSQAVVEAAGLTRDVALSILGDRNKFENLENPEDASAFDRFRQHTWKVITCLEKLDEKIDGIYSRLFRIRTAKEIRSKYPTERGFYLSDPSFMEIVRKVFREQVIQTVSSLIPQECGIRIVKSIGYKLVGVEFLGSIYALFFVYGIINNISDTYRKRKI
jgi:hypothetical protein